MGLFLTAIWVCSVKFQWTKMNEYELRWIIKDKSMHKDKNTERQKDTTPEYQWTKMNKYEKKMNY